MTHCHPGPSSLSSQPFSGKLDQPDTPRDAKPHSSMPETRHTGTADGKKNSTEGAFARKQFAEDKTDDAPGQTRCAPVVAVVELECHRNGALGHQFMVSRWDTTDCGELQRRRGSEAVTKGWRSLSRTRDKLDEKDKTRAERNYQRVDEQAGPP
ncbi:uncharacterized protein SPSK_10903 [Sporothrix schenckii 1099-18]|uniref:Uncharacterized protein n=1 Tax=Sporothrix schenckii 1099-18 TaxID=1397361 RepID=A0A0F2M7K8_SPOSC|nr:uncharacterized protein SPSK_10903 [Sporothrix schenckii 1099-18]KJR85622.1 hypothetical protein SPSK_10903 [Sporothrix schenckii 1099-18]